MGIGRLKSEYLYLANLGPRSGAEPGKVRPVLVIQSNLLNDLEHSTTTVFLCTSKVYSQNCLRTRLIAKIAGNSKECDIMIDQLRSIDNRRFIRELGRVPELIMEEVRYKAARLLDIDIKI